MTDYRIQPGDTLSKIAKQYGLTVKQLQEANGIKNPNLIFAGKDLKIPIDDDKAFDIPGLKIEPGNKDGNTPKTPKTPDNTPSLAPSFYPKPGMKTPDPSIVAMYAAPVRPSDGTTPADKVLPNLPNLPTIDPSDIKTPTQFPTGEPSSIKMPDPSIVAMYAAPVRPSQGTTPADKVLPNLPNLPTIDPSDIKTPTQFPTGEPSSIKMPDPSIVAMYAVITRPSDNEIPKDRILPTLPTITPPSIKLPEPTTEPTPEQETAPKTKELTPEQKSQAETLGKYTARYLAGYTTDTEQQAIIDNINKVDNDNVTEFLKSYEAHRGDETVRAESFFSQVLHEWSFDEKQDIMKKVALRLATNLAETGNAKDAERIKNILKKPEISEEDAQLLDKIYQHNIEE